jgi:hypothetical protein
MTSVHDMNGGMAKRFEERKAVFEKLLKLEKGNDGTHDNLSQLQN